MRFFYPQAICRATVVFQLSRTSDATRTTTFTVPVRSMELERNDFNTPDTCTVKIDAVRMPALPRMIRDVLIQVHFGDGLSIDSPDMLVAGDDFARFIGYVDAPSLELGADDGVIEWKARDYTALILAVKHPGLDIIPTYADRLDTALRRILDAVPGGANIGLQLVGADTWPTIGIGAPATLKDARLPIRPEDTAWHLIKRACDPVSLIPQIKLDKLVVSSSRGLRAVTSQAVFVYGANLKNYHETRHLDRVREGVGLRAYSVADRAFITAQWPPEGDQSVLTKRTKVAAKKNAKPKPPIDSKEKRAWFPYMPVGDAAQLLAAAKGLYDLRRFQEFEGSFDCARMVVPDAVSDFEFDGEDSFDVTAISNGDRIIVDVLPEQRNILIGLASTEDRVNYMMDRGHEADVASALVEQYEKGCENPLEVYVRKARFHLDATGGFGLHVEFENLIGGEG